MPQKVKVGSMYRRYRPHASHKVIKNHALRSRLALIFAHLRGLSQTSLTPSFASQAHQ
jgi:hypothetical protein